MNSRLAVGLLPIIVLGTACSSDGDSSPTADRSLDDTVTTVTTVSPTTGSSTTATGAPGADALRFFKAQQPLCTAFATSNGNPPVEPARFDGAKVSAVRDDGTVEIEDGAGTALVVDAEREVVLPVGGEDEVTPPPYEFGCPSDVFVRSAHD